MFFIQSLLLLRLLLGLLGRIFNQVCGSSRGSAEVAERLESFSEGRQQELRRAFWRVWCFQLLEPNRV